MSKHKPEGLPALSEAQLEIMQLVWERGEVTVTDVWSVLALVALLVATAWVGERLLARRRAALRSALWCATLSAVLLTPVLALLGRHLPWHVALWSVEQPSALKEIAAPPPTTAAAPPAP